MNECDSHDDPQVNHDECYRMCDELRDALLDIIWQFCSHNNKLSHSFMSAEEHAFAVLNLENGMSYFEAEEASKLSLVFKK